MPENGGGSSGEGRPTGSQPGQHRVAVITAVIGAVGTVAGAVATAVIGLAGWDNGSAETGTKPTTSATSPEASSSSGGVVPTTDSREPGANAAEDGKKCRSDWVPVATAGAEIQPCIQRRAEGFTVSVRVKADASGDAPDEVTAWVWLMHVDRELVEAGKLEDTRRPSTLRACRIPLESSDRFKTCSTKAEPWADGEYTAAAHTDIAHSERPRGWDSGTFSGTQAIYKLSGTP